jgi:hypothetical protein
VGTHAAPGPVDATRGTVTGRAGNIPRARIFRYNLGMSISALIRIATVVALVVLCGRPSVAQPYEVVGTRAQGMSGAFVAVADDASAGWWNPAGLATGAIFNLVIEKGRISEPPNSEGLEPAMTSGSWGFALALPSLGINNYHVRVSQVEPLPGIAKGDAARQEEGVPLARAHTLSLNQFGVTVGQSFGGHFVVGSTVKIVSGGVESAIVDGTRDALGVADDLDVQHETKVDFDIGVMLAFSHLRVGAAMRNVTTPEFGEGADRVPLDRQSRAGVAFLSGRLGILESLVVDADFDLGSTSTPFGDTRHMAVGAEATMNNRRLLLRGGASRNSVGAARPAASTGVSYALTRGFFIEAAGTFGADDSLRGWSSDVRFSF